MTNHMVSIGLMSGTSMDGIDAALIKTDGALGNVQELGHTSLAYCSEFKILLKAAEFSVRKCKGDLSLTQNYYPVGLKDYLLQQLNLSENVVLNKIHDLNEYLLAHSLSLSLSSVISHSTQLHAQVVKKLLHITEMPDHQINVIGYHGQTLFHQPEDKISVIVGNGQQLADLMNICVVNDFRSSDIAAGGQGAPLAPLYHQTLAVRDGMIPVGVLNCGGIANVTLIYGDRESDMIAFDTGPGNGLVDQFVRLKTHGQEHMDFNGNYGKQGQIKDKVLTALYQSSIFKKNQNYFLMPPPKSLDIGDLQLISDLQELSLEDGCATLEAFTADSIVSSLQQLKIDLPERWVLSGGGWHNPVILDQLRKKLKLILKKELLIQTADQAGWNSQAMEAQIFAFLAVRSLKSMPLSFPNTTGVPFPLSGGTIYSA